MKNRLKRILSWIRKRVAGCGKVVILVLVVEAVTVGFLLMAPPWQFIVLCGQIYMVSSPIISNSITLAQDDCVVIPNILN